jgi:outer membrane protein assembly factor BamB
LTFADGCLYLFGEGGNVALIEANPRAYRELSRFKLPEHGSEPSWAHPVVCGGRLYLRTDGMLRVYDVKG